MLAVPHPDEAILFHHSPTDFPCFSAGVFSLGCTERCCVKRARTPDGEDSPAWLIQLARQEEAEAIPFELESPESPAELEAPAVELEAPATPETKMQDLAAPADGFGWTPMKPCSGWEVANARVGVVRPRIAGHSFIN